MNSDSVAPALAALGDCMAALERLDKTCCLPERSPRMAALSSALEATRAQVVELDSHPEMDDSLISSVEDIGAQIGRLQVGCCAPSRMPLYEVMLDGLNVVQRTVSAALDRRH